MRASVIVFPGSNCDRDVMVALTQASGKAPNMIWHADTTLPASDLIVIPGGFSYGDYLRTGAMAAHSPIMNEVIAQAKKGVRVLGICNGFQILCETQLLPGVLLRNKSLKFVCRHVPMEVANTDSDFTRAYQKGQVLSIPIAHGDGNYFADDATLKRLEDKGQIALRYCDNPNGAARNIAGIFNESRSIMGLMPHPERAADPLLGSTDGQGVFKSLVESLA
ncbi:MAG: phosphoribosylformylglycinamidine synthase subunit PurQ [Proteobacteria bacterium]|nr:phosphoribosylformylglycinamidine synthase subunit PurQ [Pseudomonadota bacterium]